MHNLFIENMTTTLLLLGIPTLLYFIVTNKFAYKADPQLSEALANFNIFNSLYSIFLSMALITLLVNFNTVKDDTRKEAESITSAARLMSGLTNAGKLKLALLEYAKSVVNYDLKALKSGNMSNEALLAFNNLWDEVNKMQINSTKDEYAYHLVMGELSDISKSRLNRRMKAKDNLHPLVFSLLIIGYYIMLIKTYLTRLENKRIQRAYEICVFGIMLLVIVTIVDLNTPFVGIVNIETSSFNIALERVTQITLNQ